MLNKKMNLDQKITYGSFKNLSKDNVPGTLYKTPYKIPQRGYGTNELFDPDKCVIHLVDLTSIHITNFLFFDMQKDTNTSYDTYSSHNSSDNTDNDNIDSGDSNNSSYDSYGSLEYVDDQNKKFNINMQNVLRNESQDTSQLEILLQQHLKLLIDYITDQHCELWDMMKRGDLIEDVSITKFNDCLDNVDNFSPTRGRYIVDKIDNDLHNDLHKKNNRLKGSDIVRNGLTIKYLVRDSGPKKNTRYTIPINMHTITDFPIGYFDDTVTNDYLCPLDTPRTSWGIDSCLISLDVNRLRLDKLTKNKIHHISKNKIDNNNGESLIVDYLYTIILFGGAKYMIISEYSSKLIRYNMKNELIHFINKFKTPNYIITYNKKEDANVKEIANKENVLINNVLCI